MKNCTHKDCIEINPQPKSYFNKHPKMNDGLGSNCKSCQRRLNKIGTKKWKLNNPGKNAALASKYHASKLQRTPKWLTKKQFIEIQEFYLIAADLSWLSEEPLEVDHIIPLQGKNVSGLHVPWNLRIIPSSENRRKHNKVF